MLSAPDSSVVRGCILSCALHYFTFSVTTLVLVSSQEMVLDKTQDGVRPRYLIYDIMQFEVKDPVHVCHMMIA